MNELVDLYDLNHNKTDDIVDFWFIKQDFKIQDLKLQKEEVSDAKWVSLKELKEMILTDLFVPTINFSYETFVKHIELNL